MEVIIPYPRLVLLLEGLKEVMWVWSQVKSSAQRGSPGIMQVYSRALFVTGSLRTVEFLNTRAEGGSALPLPQLRSREGQ